MKNYEGDFLHQMKYICEQIYLLLMYVNCLLAAIVLKLPYAPMPVHKTNQNIPLPH